MSGRGWAVMFLCVPLLGVGVFLLAAAGWGPLAGGWLPPGVTAQGQAIDHLFLLIHYLMGGMLLLTGLLLAWCLWRYADGPGRRSAGFRDSIRWEVSWSVAAGVILVFLAFYQLNSWADNRMRAPTIRQAGADVPLPPMARVVARQFDWEVYYPGPDGVLGTPDDWRDRNLLVVPSGRDVVIELESRDVIHSFFVRELRLKQDTVPGMVHRVWFHALREGEFEILCAELCGWGHYQMRGRLRIVSPREFDRWQAERQLGRAGATPQPGDKGSSDTVAKRPAGTAAGGVERRP